MSIVLKEITKKKLEAVEREFDYKGLVRFTMRVDDDDSFTSALSQVHQQEQTKPKKLTKKNLSKANNTDVGISTGEAFIYLVGEYLVTDWDVTVPNGDIAPINGDSFMALCATVGKTIKEQIDFVAYVSDAFAKLSAEFAAQKEVPKKKPSKRGGGKKKRRNSRQKG